MNTSTQGVVKTAAPLDELMLAMDVVDTLRHRELVLERELDAEDRDKQLLTQLREIYSSQGIVVTDEVLGQGVSALREERFIYTAPVASFSRTLATLYVTRGRWGKWVGGFAAIVAIGALVLQFAVLGPQQRAIAEVPANLQGAYQGIVVTTGDERALTEARGYLSEGEAAVAGHDYDAARTSVGQLNLLSNRLQQQYELHVVSRPREQSGVWRVPNDNTRARNFYLIVEAVAPNGAHLALPIRNEEDGRTERVQTWGLRVDEDTFNKVAADKRDDGIIQNDVVAVKRRGELDPAYSVATTGGAITKW